MVNSPGFFSAFKEFGSKAWKTVVRKRPRPAEDNNFDSQPGPLPATRAKLEHAPDQRAARGQPEALEGQSDDVPPLVPNGHLMDVMSLRHRYQSLRDEAGLAPRPRPVAQPATVQPSLSEPASSLKPQRLAYGVSPVAQTQRPSNGRHDLAEAQQQQLSTVRLGLQQQLSRQTPQQQGAYPGRAPAGILPHHSDRSSPSPAVRPSIQQPQLLPMAPPTRRTSYFQHPRPSFSEQLRQKILPPSPLHWDRQRHTTPSQQHQSWSTRRTANLMDRSNYDKLIRNEERRNAQTPAAASPADQSWPARQAASTVFNELVDEVASLGSIFDGQQRAVKQLSDRLDRLKSQPSALRNAVLVVSANGIQDATAAAACKRAEREQLEKERMVLLAQRKVAVRDQQLRVMREAEAKAAKAADDQAAKAMSRHGAPTAAVLHSALARTATVKTHRRGAQRKEDPILLISDEEEGPPQPEAADEEEEYEEAEEEGWEEEEGDEGALSAEEVNEAGEDTSLPAVVAWPREGFRPTKRDLQAWESMLSSQDPREVLVRHPASDDTITRHKLKCMRTGVWLNDEAINMYMLLLLDRDKRWRSALVKGPNKLPRCHFFNSFFLNKLYKDDHRYNYANVRRWTAAKKLAQSAQMSSCLLDVDRIIVPVHCGVHWTTAMVDLENKALYYLDSMNHEDRECLDHLAQWVEDEARDKRKEGWDVSSWPRHFPHNIPQQTNGCDCGVFAIIYASYLGAARPLDWGQSQMEFWRRRVTAQLMDARVD